MIFNIQRFSTHDGPGIRTVVFLKGCPLRCPWCENPEGQAAREELFYDARFCIGCLECLAASRRGEITVGGNPPRPVFYRERIRSAGRFRGVCPAAALTVVGEERSIDEIIAEGEKDIPFYRDEGGVTLSGGEPFLSGITREFTKLARKMMYDKVVVLPAAIGPHSGIIGAASLALEET